MTSLAVTMMAAPAPASDAIDFNTGFASFVLGDNPILSSMPQISSFPSLMVDMEKISKETHGYVGADVAALCTKSALQEKDGVVSPIGETTGLPPSTFNLNQLTQMFESNELTQESHTWNTISLS
ncbi:peroxidase 5 [Tanacetum coccineum]